MPPLLFIPRQTLPLISADNLFELPEPPLRSPSEGRTGYLLVLYALDNAPPTS